MLVIITALYVAFTRRIMSAALRQADSSVQQTAAVHEQAKAASRMAELALEQFAAERRRFLLPLQLVVASAITRFDDWVQSAEQPHAVDRFVSSARNFEQPMFSKDFKEALSLAKSLSPAAFEAMDEAAEAMKEMDRSIVLIKQNLEQATNFDRARLRATVVIAHLHRAQEVVGKPAA